MAVGNENYKLIVKFDDSELNAQIEKIKGAFGNLSGGKSAGSSVPANDPIKNLAHLAGIAVGVTGILVFVKKLTSAIVEASPNLQAMLDLMNNAFMLVLRPFGDFLAMILRPVMIALLKNFIIPWYQTMQSPMVKRGTELGEQLSKGDIIGFLFNSPTQPELDIGKKIQDWWSDNISTPFSDWLNDSNNLLPDVMADTGGIETKLAPVTKELNILDKAIVDIKDFVRRFSEKTDTEQKAQDNSTTIGRINQAEKERSNVKSKAKQSTIDAFLRRGYTEDQIREKLHNQDFTGTSLERKPSTMGKRTRFGETPDAPVSITINTDGRVNKDFEDEIKKVVEDTVTKHRKTLTNRYGR